MNTSLREYDVVRIIKLNSASREFHGSDSVKRPPRVGDEAIVVDYYPPNFVVEKVDPQGGTSLVSRFYR